MKYLENQELEEKLDTFDLKMLLGLFETTVRHNHYCPVECECFDPYGFKCHYLDIQDYILSHFDK